MAKHNEEILTEEKVDLVVPYKIYSNSVFFEKWFLELYSERFHQLPEFAKPDLKTLIKERNGNIDNYFITVSKVVSMALYGRDESDKILENTRTQEIVNMRRLVCYIMVRKLGYSLSNVGKIIGRDHATVLYHARSVHDHLKFDKKFGKKFSEIQENLFRLGIKW